MQRKTQLQKLMLLEIADVWNLYTPHQENGDNYSIVTWIACIIFNIQPDIHQVY